MEKERELRGLVWSRKGRHKCIRNLILGSVYLEKKAETILWTVSPFGNEGPPSTAHRERRGQMPPLHLSGGSRVAGKEHHGMGRQKAPVKSLFQYVSNSQ